MLSSGKTKLNVQVAAPSYSLLQATIQDFTDCLGFTVVGSKLYGDHCVMPNGSIWQFIAYDCMEKTVGRKCDILFLNEAILLPEEAFTTLMQGVRQFAILNFNPTRQGWPEKFVKDDRSNLFITTFKDNPYLTPAQVEEFESIKKRAQSPTASMLDLFQYNVYYLGNYSDVGGKVFPMLYTCTEDEYQKLPVKESLGMDFSFKDSADATVLMGVKIYQNCLYIKEYINSTSLANNEKLALAIADCGFDCYNTIFCDMGGLGKERIKALCSAGDYTWSNPAINKGFNCVNAKKGRVVDGLQRMLQFDKIIITENSQSARKEFERYELGPDGNEVSKHQNCVDAARYATVSYNNLY